MKVGNTTIFVGDNRRDLRQGTVTEEKGNRSTIFAGDLNGKNDPVARKMLQAKKQVMKVIGDAMSADQSLTDQISNERSRMKDYQKEIGQANEELKWIEDERAALRETYGVAEDSQEEQDLRLLEREQDACKAGSGVILTEAEREELDRIHGEGVTEYQKRSLELREGREYYEKKKLEAQDGMKAANQSVSAMQRELEKSQTMLKAEKSAEDILETARKEAAGMLYDEAKDHIDEEMEEKKEEALEKAEKEKEEEEKLEKIKEEKEEKEEFAEQVADSIADSTALMTEADSVMDEVQREIKKIMDELKLTQEDIKGAAVDASL